jgi:hypothetical protein
MKMIRVRYDAYNRQFTLLDRQSARLHDGDIYLVMDITSEDAEDDSAPVSEVSVVSQHELAHS